MVATAIYSVTMVLLLLLLSILAIKYVLLVHCVELTSRLASQGVVVHCSAFQSALCLHQLLPCLHCLCVYISQQPHGLGSTFWHWMAFKV